MKELTWSSIQASFDPIDREALAPPPGLAEVPWEDLDYFAWKDPSGHRAFLCVEMPERMVGLVLRLYGHGRGGLCDLCLGIDRESGTSMALVESWSRPRSSFGLHVCANFDCSRGVRRQKAMDCMGETITSGHRMERLRGNLERFVRAVTGPLKPTG